MTAKGVGGFRTLGGTRFVVRLSTPLPTKMRTKCIVRGLAYAPSTRVHGYRFKDYHTHNLLMSAPKGIIVRGGVFRSDNSTVLVTKSTGT